jgi:hypothetical protein
MRGCGGTGALTCRGCYRGRGGRRRLPDGPEAAGEAVTGVEGEVTGGVFAGYGVVIGLAGESGYVIAGQPWPGDQAGQAAGGGELAGRARDRADGPED